MPPELVQRYMAWLYRAVRRTGEYSATTPSISDVELGRELGCSAADAAGAVLAAVGLGWVYIHHLAPPQKQWPNYNGATFQLRPQGRPWAAQFAETWPEPAQQGTMGFAPQRR